MLTSSRRHAVVDPGGIAATQVDHQIDQVLHLNRQRPQQRLPRSRIARQAFEESACRDIAQPAVAASLIPRRPPRLRCEINIASSPCAALTVDRPGRAPRPRGNRRPRGTGPRPPCPRRSAFRNHRARPARCWMICPSVASRAIWRQRRTQPTSARPVGIAARRSRGRCLRE